MKEEDPTEFTQADESVQIGGVNVAAATGYSVSVFALSSDGKEKSVFSEVFPTRDFKFSSKIAKSYLRIEVVKLDTGGKFGAVLPPPSSDKVVKLTVDRTTSIAAKIIEIVASKARSGDLIATSAIADQSLSVADVLILAQSIRRTVDQQLIEKVPTAAIDIKPLAVNLLQKSTERMSALVAEGLATAEVAKKLSEKTYETIFGAQANAAPPGILAYRTNHDLGTSAAAKTEVAFEAIKSANSATFNTVNAAFRTEADTYRTAVSVEEATAAQEQVAVNYTAVYRTCTVASPSNCVSTSYTPPPPPLSSSATGASVLTVSSTSTDRSYNAGKTISITVSFSEVVTVTGSPTLMLETGAVDGTAVYVSGSGTSTLTFNYQVKAGDSSANLNYVNTAALALNGGSIIGSSGATAILTLPALTGPGSLAVQKDIQIDTLAPTVTFVSIAPGATASTRTPQVTINASEESTVALFNNPSCAGANSISAYVERVAGNYTLTTTQLASSQTTNIYSQIMDRADNLSPCTLLVAYTHDPGVDSPPTPGSFGPSTNVTSSGFRLNWTAASDDVTASSGLQYFVCSGASLAEIDTVAECETSTQKLAWSVNTLEFIDSGLSANTPYYYNVLVKDAAGNKAAYAPKMQKTTLPTATETNHLSIINSSGSSQGVCHLFGDPAGSGWTSCDSVLTVNSGYVARGASLTLDVSNNLWIGLSSLDSSGSLMHKLANRDASTAAVTSKGQSILSSGVNTTRSESATVVINSTNRVVSLGSVFNASSPNTSQFLSRIWTEIAMGSWAAQKSSAPQSSPIGQPGPRALTAFSDSSANVHAFFVYPAGNGYLKPDYLILNTTNDTWNPASAGAPTKSGSNPNNSCADVSYVTAATDYAVGNGRPHAVYYCRVIGSGAYDEIVYAYYEGSVWNYQLVTSGTIIAPTSIFDSRFGFAIHNNVAHIAYWNTSGHLEYKRRENGIWSSATLISETTDNNDLHTPQVGISTDGKVRIYFIKDNTSAGRPYLTAFFDNGTSMETSYLYSFRQNSLGTIFLGTGVGIPYMPGNSHQ